MWRFISYLSAAFCYSLHLLTGTFLNGGPTVADSLSPSFINYTHHIQRSASLHLLY